DLAASDSSSGAAFQIERSRGIILCATADYLEQWPGLGARLQQSLPTSIENSWISNAVLFFSDLCQDQPAGLPPWGQSPKRSR
ncbi:hypothetical protein, partial [Mesorhizobium sp. M3A.F.Ca.ET.201.01.1.1]|uniref:hypothetical protein n=1 Tax=Mesorhizobium sp. M3A.F.Ca.ET.201.01.1.1 TaxID=2563946 RepID=UPI001AEF1321